MKNEQIDMFEVLQMINETVTVIQRDIIDFKNQVNDRFDTLEKRMNQRFDYHETRLNQIEKNMVQKSDLNRLFRALIISLSEKEIIAEAETRYFFSQTQN